MIEDILQAPSNIDELHSLMQNPRKFGNDVVWYQGQELDELSVDLAIIGLPLIQNDEITYPADIARVHLYELARTRYPGKLMDLGNLKAGAEITDTYAALGTLLKELHEKKIVCLLLGGLQDLTQGQYRCFSSRQQWANLTVIDERLDMFDSSGQSESKHFLEAMFNDKPSYLFNFSLLGYQSHFVEDEALAILEELYFECCRLGFVKNSFEEVEPIIRDSDIVSFDLGAVKASDSPGSIYPTPNGFTGEEACRLARYAGTSERVSSFGVYEWDNQDDLQLTAQLVAQMSWYFLDGMALRQPEYPHDSRKDFLKYIVQVQEDQFELIFFKNRFSGRWWIQLEQGDHDEEPRYVPCSYADYESALKEEIPDRWLRAWNKLDQ